MSKQGGFTLIELVIVIVILGILAATALPKFVNLKDDAAEAAVKGAAGALSSAAAINYATRSINSTRGVAVNAANACAALTGAAMAGWDSTKFAIATDGTCTAALASTAGTVNCTLRSADVTTKTASATVVCID